MAFMPDIAAIRFGEGLAPAIAPPSSVGDILDQLRGPDLAAREFPVTPLREVHGDLAKVRDLQVLARQGRNGADAEELVKAYKLARRTLNLRLQGAIAPVLSRSITTGQPFRERLTRFWADHFTVVGRNSLTRNVVPAYVEESIRPHIAGRFSDMLKAVMTSSMMLDYLDQNKSVGPNSRGAKGRRGLNEIESSRMRRISSSVSSCT